MYGTFSLSNLNKNHYFVIGILLGLVLSVYVPEEIREISKECAGNIDGYDKFTSGEEFEPQLNLAQKPLAAKKLVKNFIRPRYYSSELGIVLFVDLINI